jgi:plasmid stability protein
MRVAKTNLTLQLDEEVIRRARVVAAKRGTSVSALVARELDQLVAQEERYEEARHRASELMAQAKPRGGRSWTREDIYAERLDRFGR